MTSNDLAREMVLATNFLVNVQNGRFRLLQTAVYHAVRQVWHPRTLRHSIACCMPYHVQEAIIAATVQSCVVSHGVTLNESHELFRLAFDPS
jgi:hypothetical protein